MRAIRSLQAVMRRKTSIVIREIWVLFSIKKLTYKV